MQRFLLSAFISLTLVMGAGLVPAAHAQSVGTACVGDNSGAAGTCQSASACGSTSNVDTATATCGPSLICCSSSAIQFNGVTDTSAANTPKSLQLPSDNSQGFAQVMIWIMELFAWLVGVAAVTLNYAMYYTVVTMGNYVNNLSAVGVTWRVLRDIANIMLIFGFLGAGITTILNVELYGWKTKMLPMLLAGAVLLNFSLFISEALVDSTNLFATQFYAQINGGQLPTLDHLDTGISDKIMSQLGLQTIYGQVRNTDKAAQLVKAGNSWIIGFMGVLLFLITAFVMFSLAFILIARFVVLVLLLVVSPVAFMGMAIPNMQYRAGQWWKNFLEQIVTAPVLVLLLYVALAVITDAKVLTGFGSGTRGDWLGFIDNGNLAGFASMMLSFLVAMGLLLVVLIKAKSMSAFGAGWATKTAGSLTFGTVGLAGRYTGGLGANWLAKKARSSRFSRVPLVGTGITRGLEGLSKSSFDVRGSSLAGGALKTMKVDAGKAQTGGYKEALKQSIESRTKYASELKGKDFKDLSAEQQLALGARENEITRLKKNKTDAQKAGTLTPDKLKHFNEAIERAETELDTMHKEVGTERGSKLAYASTLANLPLGFKYLTANKEAAEKIKEEARKSKDDKDLEALKKMLKKAGGEEEKEEKEKKPSAEGGAAPEGGTPPPPAGGGH